MRIILSVLLAFMSFIAAAQSKKAKLDEIMKTYHRFSMFDGAVLVAENGAIVYKNAFGPANREWNIKNTTDTKFMIGSVSKPLTAMLMLIQVEKGLVSLDKMVQDYLPEFMGKPAGRVTVRQLLNHTSGMPNYDITKDFFPLISRRYFEREEYTRKYRDSALAFEPGIAYHYSSWGYFTLGYIMEKVTGKKYAELMKADLYSKAGMLYSGSYYHTQIVEKRATGYDYYLGQYKSSDFRDQSNTMGTGDIYTTAEDLYKFHLAISQYSLISKKLTEEMLTPGMRPAQYGYGWFNKMFKYSSTDSVSANFHLGMTEGFISFMLRIPQTNSCIIILCNTSPTDFFGIVGNLVKVLYNKPVSLKEPLHRKLEKSIAGSGAQKAVAEYQVLKKDTARFYTDWISMNFIAEQLLKEKRTEDARIIAENNAMEFPNRDLVNFTMGNIYLELGRKTEAAKFYRKALEIYPGNQEAKNKLNEIENK